MDHIALGDLRLDAGTHRPLKDAAEALGTPALADPGQTGVVGQGLVQAITAEPADREVDLRLPQQPAVMHDPEQEPGQHQPHRDLGVDAGPAGRSVVEVGDLVVQPAQIEHAVHPNQHVVVRQHVTQRPGDEQLRLPTLLTTQHLVRLTQQTTRSGSISRKFGFFNSPSSAQLAANSGSLERLKVRRSAMDRRTTRHAGYERSANGASTIGGSRRSGWSCGTR
jgi:hypothetical protein